MNLKGQVGNLKDFELLGPIAFSNLLLVMPSLFYHNELLTLCILFTSIIEATTVTLIASINAFDTAWENCDKDDKKQPSIITGDK